MTKKEVPWNRTRDMVRRVRTEEMLLHAIIKIKLLERLIDKQEIRKDCMIQMMYGRRYQ